MEWHKVPIVNSESVGRGADSRSRSMMRLALLRDKIFLLSARASERLFRAVINGDQDIVRSAVDYTIANSNHADCI